MIIRSLIQFLRLNQNAEFHNPLKMQEHPHQDQGQALYHNTANIIPMVTVSARKRLESIERDVIPSMFVGVLSKEDAWLKHTIEDTLPMLEERALHLSEECKKTGECAEGDPLCDETRIRELFKKTREKLKEEHATREARTRFHH